MDTAAHPVLAALDHRIDMLRKAYRSQDNYLADDSSEKALLDQIAELQSRLDHLRAQRANRDKSKAVHDAELKALTDLRAKCVSDDKIATLVWMQMLAKRNTK